jgi:membrane protein YqaA with SNARE-associated domain
MSLWYQDSTAIVTRAKQWLQTKNAAWAIIIGSFLESALITPFIIDPLVVAYILADKSRVVFAVIITALSSVAGGVAAYLMAHWFFEHTIMLMLSPETLLAIEPYTARMKEEAFLMSFIGALTPVPYTFVSLAAGMVDAGLVAFTIACVIGRTMRYAVLGWLTYYYGERALALMQRKMLVAIVAAIIGGGLYLYLFHY